LPCSTFCTLFQASSTFVQLAQPAEASWLDQMRAYKISHEKWIETTELSYKLPKKSKSPLTASGRCSVPDRPDRGQDIESCRLCYFPKLPRIEAHRKGVLGSYEKLRKSAIEAPVWSAFGHFITKTRSLENGWEDRKATKDWSRGWGGAPGGRKRRKLGGSGDFVDKST
jgi:hypothetical protein